MKAQINKNQLKLFAVTVSLAQSQSNQGLKIVLIYYFRPMIE